MTRGRQFSVRSRDVLINAQRPHKWWSTLKSAVFGSSSDSSLPPLIGGGGRGGVLVCASVGKAKLLSSHFDSKQSREADGKSLDCLCLGGGWQVDGRSTV